MPETTDTRTVYEMICGAVEKGDNRFHRRIDAYWLKQYVTAASDYDTMDDEQWALYADAAANMVTRFKTDRVESAMQALADSVNWSDQDLLMDAMRKVHPYLFNEIMTAGIQTVKNYHMNDGRISGMYKDLAEKNFI